MVRGILDDKVPRGATYKGVKVLGSINNLLYILPENKLDEIAITLSLENYDRLEDWWTYAKSQVFIRSLYRIITV